MNWVPPEINVPRPQILVVGRDPGEQEVRAGKPFVGPAGEVLERALARAGIRRQDIAITNLIGRRPPNNDFRSHNPDDIETGLRNLHELVSRLRPNLVVTLGNEAAWAFLRGQDWPGQNIYGDVGLIERRGFFWDSLGCAETAFGGHRDLGTQQKLITTLHPDDILSGNEAVYGAAAKAQEWLLVRDLLRAKQEAASPTSALAEPEVLTVTNDHQASSALAELSAAQVVACDIENYDSKRLACIGFAGDGRRAYVFTEPAFQRAFDFLSRPGPHSFVFQNGSYDLYFLRTRCGLRSIPCYREDTIVQFHSLYIELAGAAQDAFGKKKAKRTQKGLAFLASLYAPSIPFWKDYNFSGEHERHRLNGIDCCATWLIHHVMRDEAQRMGASEAVYRHGISLIPVVVDVLERGIKVDEGKRLAALGEIQRRLDAASDAAVAAAKPALEAARPDLHRPGLFWKTTVCRCCRNGRALRAACWRCTGFERKPGKKALGDRVLGPCAPCGGAGSSEVFDFNPRSDAQKKILLYDVMRVPKRYNEGKLSADEAKLKSLLPLLKGEKLALVQTFLSLAKLETMRRIYERLAPGPDGRIRTFLSIVGTDTARLASSNTRIEVSTNLQNIPKKTAALDPLYDIRSCLVPSSGHVLIEGDYSQIEARLTSAFAGDRRALAAFAAGEDIHRKTAAAIFGVAEGAVSKEQRHLGKMSRHALNYGMGWQTFLEAINSDADLTGISISAAQAKEICDGYRRMSPEVTSWWDSVLREVRERGSLTTPFGRRRLFFDRTDAVKNAAIAYLPQSTAADLVNHALVRARDAGLRVLLQIHDAILIEALTTEWRSAAKRLHHIMTDHELHIGDVKLRIPVEIGASSTSWAEMRKVAT